MILGIPLPTADPDITFFLLCRLSSPILSFCLFWKQHTYPQRPTALSLISMFVFLIRIYSRGVLLAYQTISCVSIIWNLLTLLCSGKICMLDRQ